MRGGGWGRGIGERDKGWGQGTEAGDEGPGLGRLDKEQELVGQV